MGLCSDDIPYLILLLNINHYLNIELKFNIIKSLPFQGIIGIKAIRQQSLVKHFTTFFELSKAGIAHEARKGYVFNDIIELPPSTVEVVTVSSKRKLANIFQCECEAGNSTSAGNLKGSHDPVTLSRVVASVAQSYSQGSDGDSWKEYPNIDRRIGALLEHIEPPPGLVRRKEELLSSILPEVDTFAPFTDKATGTQPLLELVKLGDNSIIESETYSLSLNLRTYSSRLFPESLHSSSLLRLKLMKSYDRSLKTAFHLGY